MLSRILKKVNEKGKYMKKIVVVTQRIEVTIDEAKFDEEFLQEFRESFYPFNTVDDHIEHLAQLFARGIAYDSPTCFIEGYGEARDLGIEFEIIDTDVELED